MKLLSPDLFKVDIEKIQADPDNPNIMDNLQISGLKTSFQKFGKLQPIIIDQDFIICDGEHRLKALKEVGETQVEVFQVNVTPVERRLLRQTMNKLRGRHDTTKDSLDILRIFEENRLDELRRLLGKPNLEDFKILLSKHQGIEFTTSDGIPDIFGAGALVKKYGQPPFTILDTMTKSWRERKEQWIRLGLLSYEGREHVTYFNTRLLPSLPSVSIYDPVLCEIMYRWFTPHPDSLILDPFSGGTTRGMVASMLGHRYVGVDLSQKQIDANYKQYERIKHRLPQDHHKPIWLRGDSLDIDKVITENTEYKEGDFEMLQTSPPYFAQEHYSKDPQDLNTLKTFDEFLIKYLIIIDKSCSLLKEKGSFVAWNTTNTRDRNNGRITNIIAYITQQFEKHGFFFLNDLILVRAIGSLQMLAPRHFRKHRYCGQRHENVLVYYRGETRNDVPPLDLTVVDIPIPTDDELYEDDVLANPKYDKKIVKKEEQTEEEEQEEDPLLSKIPKDRDEM